MYVGSFWSESGQYEVEEYNRYTAFNMQDVMLGKDGIIM